MAALVTLVLVTIAPVAGWVADEGCLSCHAGIEEMHPWLALSCTECHGGDGAARTEAAAHVAPRVGWPADERVMHTGFDPPAVRFRNPADLRVASQVCGGCRGKIVEHLPLSLHGTTAGHLNDGLYENGLNPTRAAVYSIFEVADARPQRPPGALARLLPLERLPTPATTSRAASDDLGAHFADLPAKACMQCHLWSDGLALRGRLGHDGLYRGAGCAACHVPYAEDGLSVSADPTVDRFEPGHPRRHEMTAAPPTETCTSCHVGDASIGNGFRGMAQLYPDMPAGPDVPGTTDRLIANQFFLRDETLLPPDVHHAVGMHCIDCHDAEDVMGDGNLWGAMEQAVAIECTSCHGTFIEHATLRNERGRRLDHVQQKGELFVLTSKVTGRVHRVKQAKDVVDPDHPDYNERAAAAMVPAHDRLECYACHSGWNTNFFGFHFDRNEQFSQLDLVRGAVTRGVVSTQERVFATLRQYLLGFNPEGRIAPYMVGFSSMGTVHGEDGGLLVDQGLPVTAAGLSGMTLIHHQTHTNQPAARSCIECHRSPATFGLGSGGTAGGSFALARGLIVTAGERGLSTLLLDRTNPERSIYLARLPLGGARAVVLDSDPLTGHAQTAFVALADAGVALVDVSNPAFPSVMAFAAAGDARDVALAGDLLLVANGVGGLRVVDVSDRRNPQLVSDLVTTEARGLAAAWPRVFVADGAGGLVIADLSVPSRPRIVGQAQCAPEGADDATAVAVLFQYGRPQGPAARTPARQLAAVANGTSGFWLLDVTEAESVVRLGGVGGDRYRDGTLALDVALFSRFELGDTTGSQPTLERDVACLLTAREDEGSLFLVDVTDPVRPALLDRARGGQGRPAGLALLRSFDPPLLSSRLLVAGSLGLAGLDVTDSDAVRVLFNLLALSPVSDVAVEAFAFDRTIDEGGRPLKDISHEGARYLTAEEVHRVLTVPGEALGTLERAGELRQQLRAAYADAAVPGGEPLASVPVDRGDQARLERMLDRLQRGFRIAGTESLAWLVRPAHPPAWDKNGDAALSRGELERLVFDLLDANGDGQLSALEWPRHPGQDPTTLDRNGDGVVARTEMGLDRDVLRFFDLDGDGLVQFREWPWEVVVDPLPGLHYASLEGLRKLLESTGFDRRRWPLYQRLTGSHEDEKVKPHDVPDERLQQFLDRARDQPLIDVGGERLLGGFLQRWDLDGDGAVTPAEHTSFARIAPRCDLDGDGRITAADAAPKARR